MDQMPIGMGRCGTGGKHTAVFNVNEQREECLDCALPLEEWSIYIPEWEKSVNLWLSLYVIPEEPF